MTEREDLRGGLLAAAGEVVEEAREFEVPAHLARDDLGAHAALAHEQAGADQLVHRLAHGRAREVELRRELDLVLEPRAGLKGAAADHRLDALDHLVVQGNGG